MSKISDVKYVAVFDSGVGGLTILNKAKTMLPYENYIYYADSVNVPYGDRPADEVLSLVETAVERIAEFPLKAVVLACNTATSIAAKSLRELYDFPIIGMEPAVKPAILEADPRRVLVLGTQLTLAAPKYIDLIKSLDVTEKVDELPMQQLVDFAEEFDFESAELQRYLKSTFRKIKWENYHSVVMGCTHFLYFKSIFRKFIPPHIHFIDGHEGTIKQLSEKIERSTIGIPNPTICLLSGMEVSQEVILPYLNFLNGQHSRFFSSVN